MFNDELLGLLLIITDIIGINETYIVLNSLHRDCYMLYGEEWR